MGRREVSLVMMGSHSLGHDQISLARPQDELSLPHALHLFLPPCFALSVFVRGLLGGLGGGGRRR